MKRLAERPSLEQLKKQAKDLLAAYRRGEPDALDRFWRFLPLAGGKEAAAIQALALKLHDAQSCLAREYGFPSWLELAGFVQVRRAYADDRDAAILTWLRLVYAGDISGGTQGARPAAAARLLRDHPDLTGGDPYLACTIGDAPMLRSKIAEDPAWVDRPGGPLALPPLLAVTHSGLLRLPAFREALRASVRLLLAAGADPNQSVASRWPPASLEKPSENDRLSALYGAAGRNHDAVLTRLLLETGADPNDGESLYHAVEDADCTRLLLAAGARVAGTNALYRVLDLERPEVLRLLLAAGADANEPPAGGAAAGFGQPLLWAIRRRRSPAVVEALLQAGADPAARTSEGIGAYRLALRYGLGEVAELLFARGGGEALSQEEHFLAACSAGEARRAEQILAERPDLPAALSADQLALLPELAALGQSEAVRLMVRLGWPIEVRAGDFEASALNHAVFRGDAALTRFLLEAGADWRAQHGFGDNVCGTLSWASVNRPVPEGDWTACAEALLQHGLPAGRPDPRSPTAVMIEATSRTFSEEVAEMLLATGVASSSDG